MTNKSKECETIFAENDQLTGGPSKKEEVFLSETQTEGYFAPSAPMLLVESVSSEIVTEEEEEEMDDENIEEKAKKVVKKKVQEAVKKSVKEEDDEEDDDEEEEDDDKESDDDEEEMEEGCKSKKKGVKEEKAEEEEEEVVEESYDFSDDIDALSSDETNLSEAFKTKAATIFEAAMNKKVREIKEELRLEAEVQIAEAVDMQVDAAIDVMTTSLDSYVSHIAEEWMKENELAIENGIRTEIAENFIGGLKTLFTESYIEVPDDKIDLVDELTTVSESLKEKANVLAEEKLDLLKKLNGMKKNELVREASEGLSLVESEKLKELTADLVLESEEAFEQKLTTLKDAYFGSKEGKEGAKKAIKESFVKEKLLGENTDTEKDGPKKGNSRMDQYVSALNNPYDVKLFNTSVQQK